MARKTKNKQTKVTQSDYQVSTIEYESAKWEFDMTVSGVTFKLPVQTGLVSHIVIRTFGKGWIWDFKDYDDLSWATSLIPQLVAYPRSWDKNPRTRLMPGVIFTTPADAAADVCLNPLPEPFNERAPKGQGWTLYRS